MRPRRSAVAARDDELHLAEKVAAERPVVVAQQQLARGAHPLRSRPQGACRRPGGTGAARPGGTSAGGTPLRARRIRPVRAARSGVRRGGGRFRAPPPGRTAARRPGPSRSGLGSAGVELRLVDVDARAEDRAGERRSRVAVFDEDADHLAVADVDVVRPLDARVDAELVETVRQGQRHQFDEAELLDDGQERRREDVREGEALPPRGSIQVWPRCPRPAVCRSAQMMSPWPYFAAAWRRRWSRWSLRCGKSCLKAVIPRRRNRAGRRSARFSCRWTPCAVR